MKAGQAAAAKIAIIKRSRPVLRIAKGASAIAMHPGPLEVRKADATKISIYICRNLKIVGQSFFRDMGGSS